LKSNKSAILYQAESPVISLTSNLSGTAILVGHLDGTINRCLFEDASSGTVSLVSPGGSFLRSQKDVMIVTLAISID
jgi:hypothetical protein